MFLKQRISIRVILPPQQQNKEAYSVHFQPRYGTTYAAPTGYRGTSIIPRGHKGRRARPLPRTANVPRGTKVPTGHDGTDEISERVIYAACTFSQGTWIMRADLRARQHQQAISRSSPRCKMITRHRNELRLNMIIMISTNIRMLIILSIRQVLALLRRFSDLVVIIMSRMRMSMRSIQFLIRRP